MVQTIQEKNYHFYIETDVSRYIGEWIAVCEGKIIAHGKILKNVAREAKSLCFGKKFLLARVPDKETMIF